MYLDDSLTEVEDQAYSPPLAKRMKMGGMSNDNQVESVFPLFDFFLSEKCLNGEDNFLVPSSNWS